VTAAPTVGRLVQRGTWLAFASVTAATFSVNLDRTMTSVALPQIGVDLGATGLDAVVTANLIAVAVASPGSGWLADRFGSRRTLCGALAVLVGSSLVSAGAASMPMLIASRAVQGASGGVVLSITLAVIHGLFAPEHRPRAFAIQAAVVMVSPALGPIFGGYLASFDWRGTFLVLAVVAAVALGLALRFLPVSPGRDPVPSIDWPGWILAGVGFPMLLLVTTSANEWGWTATPTIGAGLAATSLLAVFARRELTIDAPLLRLHALSNRVLATTFALEWIITVPYQSQFVLLPLELTTVAGQPPLRAGIMITPSAIGTMLALRPASVLLARRGVRINVLIGTACLVAATFGLTLVDASIPLWVVALVMVPHGLGGGFCLMPLLVAGLDAVEEDLVSQVSAMRIVNKLIAQAVGVSVSVGLLVALMGDSDVLLAARSDPARALAAYVTVDRLLLIPAVLGFVVAASSRSLRARR